MISLDIYKRNWEIVYKTTIFSKTTVFVVLIGLLSILFPFIVAYKSKGFWLKHDTFYEQPIVRFEGQYLLLAFTNNEDNDLISCTNMLKSSSFKDSCSTIKVREIDANFDRKVDTIEFQIEISLNNSEILKYFNLILPLDYKLNDLCPLQMQSAIIIQESLQITKLNILDLSGNLRMVQKQPLYCFKKGVDTSFNQSLIDESIEDLDDLDFRSIIRNYPERKMFTHFSDVYQTTSQSFQPNNLKINVQIYIPEEKFYYTPGFWQVLKWAWIQYFAIYVIIGWALKKIKDYMFAHNLLLYYKVLPNLDEAYLNLKKNL